MTKKSDAPAIRFKGFSDAWEQRKVQGVADRFDNLRIPVAANLRVHGTTPYYGANGIQDYVEGFTHDGEFVLVAEDGANDLKNYPVKCVNGRIWVNNHAHVLQGKAGIADNSFLAFAISQSDIESLLVGGGRAKLNAETLMSIEFRLPCLQEQYRIGEYLTQLNHLITLHQRKFEKLTNVKKSMLEKMFPQNGSSYPEIRFKGFTDPWEQRKLASLCEKFTDGDWIESKDQSDFGVRLVQTGNVGVAEYLDKTNNKKWISEDTFDRLHCEEVLPGDILISRLPEPAGRACIVPLLGTKMITAVDCTIVRTAPDMSNKFLVQYLSSQAYFDDVNTCLAGGTRQRISRGNLANFNVPIPVKKSEQDAIGMFFGYLDNLITLHQRQTIVYAVIRSIRKVILAERQYFAPPMVRKSP